MTSRRAPAGCARRLARAALVTGVAMTAIACGDQPSSDASTPPAVRDASTLLAAPAQLEANGTSLSLEVEAWRSFQPTMDTIPRRLIAVLRLHAMGAGVPGALGLDGVWLVHAGEVVRADAREEQPREAGARTVEFVLRDGPLWPPGDSLDVVASVTGIAASPRLLRAPRTVIARVD